MSDKIRKATEMETVYIDLGAEREADRQRQAELEARGLPALQRLVEVAQGHSGQSHHCRRILLAVYNADDWPLELTRLRCLDRDLQAAALTVIEWNAYTGRELHEFLENGNRIMQAFWEREMPSQED